MDDVPVGPNHFIDAMVEPLGLNDRNSQKCSSVYEMDKPWN